MLIAGFNSEQTSEEEKQHSFHVVKSEMQKSALLPSLSIWLYQILWIPKRSALAAAQAPRGYGPLQRGDDYLVTAVSKKPPQWSLIDARFCSWVKPLEPFLR